MQHTNQEYNFSNIILIESTFKRLPVVNFVSPEYKNDISIGIESQKEGNTLSVFLTVNVSSGNGDILDVEAKVKMAGIFQKNTEVNEIDMDSFGKVNAPAIIFPFIREHIASISSKAGIPTILLPPINFVKMAESETID